MKRAHDHVVDLVSEFFTNKGKTTKKEISYKISMPGYKLNRTFFRVDLVVTHGNKEIGIECKTVKDSNTFRKIMAGVGQAYILQKVFGKSYLAIEIDENTLLKNNPREFFKRETILTNINRELGIGILFVGKKFVNEVEEAKYIKPAAKTLFIKHKK